MDFLSRHLFQHSDLFCLAGASPISCIKALLSIWTLTKRTMLTLHFTKKTSPSRMTYFLLRVSCNYRCDHLQLFRKNALQFVIIDVCVVVPTDQLLIWKSSLSHFWAFALAWFHTPITTSHLETPISVLWASKPWVREIFSNGTLYMRTEICTSVRAIFILVSLSNIFIFLTLVPLSFRFHWLQSKEQVCFISLSWCNEVLFYSLPSKTVCCS